MRYLLSTRDGPAEDQAEVLAEHAEVIRTCQDHGFKRVLRDIRSVPVQWTPDRLHQLAAKMADMYPQDFRIAVLHAFTDGPMAGKALEDMQTFEDMAKVYGVKVACFTDQTAAVEWLTSD